MRFHSVRIRLNQNEYIALDFKRHEPVQPYLGIINQWMRSWRGKPMYVQWVEAYLAVGLEPSLLVLCWSSWRLYALCSCFNGGNLIYPRNKLCSHPCLYENSPTLAHVQLTLFMLCAIWAARPSSVLRPSGERQPYL